MTGFLTGVAANILFGQVPDLTGAPSEGKIALTRALNVLVNPSEINLPSLLAGLGCAGDHRGAGAHADRLDLLPRGARRPERARATCSAATASRW